MVLNIDMLHGSTFKYQNVYYLVKVDNDRLSITELFTGVRCASSEIELNALDYLFELIETSQG